MRSSRVVIAVAVPAVLFAGLALARPDETVEIELKNGEKIHGRLVDFGKRVYRVEIDGKVREVEEGSVKELRFVGHETAPAPKAAADKTPEPAAAASPSPEAGGGVWRHGTNEVPLALSADGKVLLTGGQTRGTKDRPGQSGLVLWDTSRLATTGRGETVRAFGERPIVDETGHDAQINAITLVPDGRRALVGTANGRIEVLDLTTGTIRRTLRHGDDRVRSLAISPDGRIGASGNADGSLALDDLETGRELAVVRRHDRSVMGVAFSPDGTKLLTASWDKTVRLWEVATLVASSGAADSVATFAHGEAVWAVAFLPDGKKAVTYGNEGIIRVLDLAKGTVSSQCLAAGRNPLAVSPDGTRALTTERGGGVRLYDLAAGRELRRFPDWATTLAFLPDGKSALVADPHGELHVLDLGPDETPEVAARRLPFNPWAAATMGDWAFYAGHGGPLELTVSGVGATGMTVRVARADDAPRKLELGSDRPPLVDALFLDPLPKDARVELADETLTLDGQAFPCKKLTLIERGGETSFWLSPRVDAGGLVRFETGPSGNRSRLDLAGFGYAGAITWGKTREQAAAEPAPVTRRSTDTDGTPWHHGTKEVRFALSPDGRVLLSAGETRGTAETPGQSGLVLWDTSRLATTGRGETLRAFGERPGRDEKKHEAQINAVALAPNGRRALAATADGHVELWDLATGKLERTFLRGNDQVKAVAFSPDGRIGASGSFDHSFTLWDLEAGHELATVRSHENLVMALAFSPDGKKLLSGSSDKTVRLWDVAALVGAKAPATSIATFEHGDAVWHVAFLPDGKHAVSSGLDGIVRVLDLGMGTVSSTCFGSGRFPEALAVSPDGTRALASDLGGWVRLYDLATGRELRRFHELARGLAYMPEGKSALFVDGHAELHILDLGPDEKPEVVAGRFPFNPYAAANAGDWALYLGEVGPLELTVAAIDSSSVTLSRASRLDAAPREFKLSLARPPRLDEFFLDPLSPDALIEVADETITLEGRAFACKRLTLKERDGETSIWLSPSVDAGGLVRFETGPNGARTRLDLAGFGPAGAVTWGTTRAALPTLAKPVRLDAAAGAPWGRDAWRLPRGALSLAFMPDGKTVLAGGIDGSIAFIDVATGRETRRIDAHQGYVWALALTRDGKTLFSSGHDDKTVTRHDVATGKLLQTLHPRDVVQRLVPSPDEKWLIALYLTEGAGCFDLETGEELRHAPEAGEARDARFGADGKKAVLPSWHGLVSWDLVTDTVHPVKPGSTMSGYGVSHRNALSADGKLMATQVGNGDGGTMAIVDVATDDVVRSSAPSRLDFITALAFSPDGKRLVTAGQDRTVRLWDVASLRLVSAVETDDSNPDAIAFSPDGTRFVTAGSMSTLDLWNGETGERLTLPVAGHSDAVEAFARSPDGKLIASGSYEAVRLADATSGALVGEVRRRGLLGALAFSPDGKTLLVSGYDHDRGHSYVDVVDVTTRAVVQSMECSGVEGARSLEVSRDGRLVLGASDGKVMVWSLIGGKALVSTGTDTHGVATFAPDSRSVLVALRGRGIATLDIATGALGDAAGDKPVLALAWIQGGDRLLVATENALAVAGPDGVVEKALASAGGAAVLPATRRLAVAPDGKLAAARGKDGVVRVADLRAALEGGDLVEVSRIELGVSHDEPNALVFSGPRRLLLGTQKGLVRPYELVAGK